jgi:hypothetical protein
MAELEKTELWLEAPSDRRLSGNGMDRQQTVQRTVSICSNDIKYQFGPGKDIVFR